MYTILCRKSLLPPCFTQYFDNQKCLRSQTRFITLYKKNYRYLFFLTPPLPPQFSTHNQKRESTGNLHCNRHEKYLNDNVKNMQGVLSSFKRRKDGNIFYN